MTAAKPLTMVLLLGALAVGPRVTHADAMQNITWSWTAWSPQSGLIATGLSDPSLAAALDSTVAPPPPAVVAPQTSAPAPTPAPAPAAPTPMPAPATKPAPAPPPAPAAAPNVAAPVAVSAPATAPAPAPAVAVASPPAPAPAPTPAPVAAPIIPAAPAPAPPAPAAHAPAASPAPVVAAVNSDPTATAMLATPHVAVAAAAPAPPMLSGGSGPADALINLGSGPFPQASLIATGNPQAWYNSSQIVSLFGGPPSAQQQQAFSSAILQRVEQTFQLSSVPVTLTTDPNVAHAHTLSVVSNSSAQALPNAIGMTELGGSGFSFIDQAAKVAQNVDQLEWIVAHNISHELMLAFGVGENYDKSGNYIDAPLANWSMMTNPNATFSSAAAQALLGQNFLAGLNTSTIGPQVIGVGATSAQPVPEPTTIAVWSLAAAGLFTSYRSRSRLRAE